MTQSRRSFWAFTLASAGLLTALVLAIGGGLAAAQQKNPPPMNPALPRTSRSSRPVAPGTATVPPNVVQGPPPPLGTSTWVPIGPTSLNTGVGLVSGRVTGIAVDPTTSSSIYVATAGGGVWKTINGGTTWSPLTDTQVTLSMGAIAIAPTNRLRIYAATGEANNSADSNHGEGILVSSNGGATWALKNAAGAFAGVAIGQIAVDPTTADTAYAAVGGYAENGNVGVNTGIWKTTDGGNTWTNTTAANSLDTAMAWTSVVVDPNTPAIIYAAIGDYVNSHSNNAVYRSLNGGANWTLISTVTGYSTGRIGLAVSKASNQSGNHVLYVAAAQALGTYNLVYFGRSDNADAATPTFTDLTSGAPNFLGKQGSYDLAINVDSAGVVYCAGVENYGAGGADHVIVSNNLGVTWTDISIVGGVRPHTDSHAIAFDANNRMILGSDGGVFRYDPAGPSWTILNSNLNTIQFTGIGLHPTSAVIVVGGSQDNGTELFNNNILWNETDGGDGGISQISATNPSRCYSVHPIDSYGAADFFRRSDDGCVTWSSQTAGLYINPDFPNYNAYPPFVVDPADGNHVLLGTDHLNETTNGGTSWSEIGVPGGDFNPSGNHLDTVAISPANGTNPEVIYAASGGTFASTSTIFVTTNHGVLWTERDLPTCTVNIATSTGCRVNQIVTDPNDLTGMTAIAVTNNLSSGGAHVYRTADGGTTWANVSGNLPNVPVWSAQVDTDSNHTVYISTDAGVYSSKSLYSAWARFGAGLPNVQGVDLELNRSLRVVAVATHGRGAWEIALPPTLRIPTVAVLPLTIVFPDPETLYVTVNVLGDLMPTGKIALSVDKTLLLPAVLNGGSAHFRFVGGTFTPGHHTLTAAYSPDGASGYSAANGSAAITVVAVPPVAKPLFSPAGGMYLSPVRVAIGTAPAAAEVYYTTDGAAPTRRSTRYSKPITVSATETIKAIAFAPGSAQGTAAGATYDIQPIKKNGR